MYKHLIEGISVSIYNTFGEEVKIYADYIKQGFDEPCFFIDFIDADRNEKLHDRHSKKINIDIRYHDERSSISDKASIAEKLSDILDVIELNIDGEVYLVRGHDMSYKIVDYVLHFFVTYELILEKDIGTVDKMEVLNSKVEVDYGNKES